MPTKIKPSIKESIKDANGKPTNRWRLKHFYLKQATISEIHEALEKGKKKHRSKLLKELKLIEEHNIGKVVIGCYRFEKEL